MSRPAGASRRRSSTTARSPARSGAITYAELQDEVATLAAVLQDLGVAKGDRVILYMPMIPEAVFAMLACARIGADPLGGVRRLRRRRSSRPASTTPSRRSILSASCGIEGARVVAYKPLLDEAIGARRRTSPRPASSSSGRRPRPRFRRGATATGPRPSPRPGRPARQRRACRVAATDPLYILYTSGTTGRPKGVVRDNGGHMVALKWSMKNLYGVEPGEVYWAASDVGWVVGHSYIVYAPLLHGCTTILYEGKPVGTPDAGAFWRVIAEHGVVALFTAPTAFRAIKKEDPDGELLKRLRPVALPRPVPRRRAGRSRHGAMGRADPRRAGDRPLVADRDRLGDRRQSARPRRAAGEARLADRADAGLRRRRSSTRAASRSPPDTMGSIAIRLPLPPGCLPTLWNADERFRESYLTAFPGYYNTSDAGFIDEDGYVYVMGRTDDIINVAGHRLSTGGMEEVLASHPAVAECAVIGVQDALKGEVPCGFVVLKSGVEPARRRDRARARRPGAREDRPRRGLQARRSRSGGCRRPAPARSCAAR